nr:hypothetical protein Iba_chr01dCG16000 [Ipomoea batatas]
MYPYLDFFNEQENKEMEYAADPETDDQDLRSHLNARMGSDRTHPAEPPPQDPVNVIHEVPVYPQATGPAMYQYPAPRTQNARHNPGRALGKSRQDPYPLNLGRRRGVVSGRRIGVGHWTGGRHWIGHHAHHSREVLLVQGLLEGLPHGLLHLEPTFRMSPRAVAPSELFPDLLVDECSEEGLRFPGISTQETGEVGVARHLLVHLGSLTLCCLDLELRTRDPSFQCLDLLGQLLILRRQTFPQGDDVFAHHILRGLGSAEKVVRHMRELQHRKVSNSLSGWDHRANLVYKARRVFPSLSQRVKDGGRPAGDRSFLLLRRGDLLDLLVGRLFLPPARRGSDDLKFRRRCGSCRARGKGWYCPLLRRNVRG